MTRGGGVHMVADDDADVFILGFEEHISNFFDGSFSRCREKPIGIVEGFFLEFFRFDEYILLDVVSSEEDFVRCVYAASCADARLCGAA